MKLSSTYRVLTKLTPKQIRFMHHSVPYSTQPSTHFLQLRNNPTQLAKEITFTAHPIAGEQLVSFKTRVQKEILTTIMSKTYANHELLLSCPTRLAKPDENIVNAARFFEQRKLATLDLPSYNKSLITGHCLLAYIDEQGQSCEEHTISLRPDRKKNKLYRANIALDERLHKAIIAPYIDVHPVRHSSIAEEVTRWLEDALYAKYVHRTRPQYPLHCIFTPIDTSGKKQYLEKLKEVKSRHPTYSLLDHLHRYTGTSLGDIVAGQNCTIIYKLIERLTAVEFKHLIGDNPSTQLVVNTIKKVRYQQKLENIGVNDELCTPYIRKAS